MRMCRLILWSVPSKCLSITIILYSGIKQYDKHTSSPFIILGDFYNHPRTYMGQVFTTLTLQNRESARMILPGHRLVSWNMSSRSILLVSPPCLLPQQTSEKGKGVKLGYFSLDPP